MNRRFTLTSRSIPIINELQAESALDDSFDSRDSDAENENRNPTTLDLKSNSSSICNSSFNPAMSQCSRLSRVTVDAAVYKLIFTEREQHNVFGSTAEPFKAQKFFLIIGGEMDGPFDSSEMDFMFKTHKLEESSKIRQGVEGEFIPLSRCVKRYYCSVLAPKQNTQTPFADISNRQTRFRKTTLNSVQAPKPQRYEQIQRETRVVSALPRPQLNASPQPSESESSEEDEAIVSRTRSQTLTN